MAGHNKWSKIKRKKGVNDARRSKMWTRILKEVAIAVKEGGSDPDGNPRLRLALSNARGANMPKDNIQRAISKASEAGGASYTEVTYEGYAPGGIAVFVECTTDNINRTVANIRMYFSKYGGSLGTNGSLSFLFERKGVFSVPKGALHEEDFVMEMIDGGADDVELEEGTFSVTCAFEQFGAMQKKLESMNIEAENAELQRIPNTLTSLDTETARKVLRLLDALEEDDDVQAVYHNMEMTEELAENE
jgi:YebC/PmpR family DNA-binding regulatory protein